MINMQLCNGHVGISSGCAKNAIFVFTHETKNSVNIEILINKKGIVTQTLLFNNE